MSTGGHKNDEGKLKWHLLFGMADALREVVAVLTFGADLAPRADGQKGYGDGNWEQVDKARERYTSATARHFVEEWYFKRIKRDAVSGYHPLAHSICCQLFLLALDLRGKFDEKSPSQETGIRVPVDVLCVCGHYWSQHSEVPSKVLPSGSTHACRIVGCGCGPGCIPEGFVPANNTP